MKRVFLVAVAVLMFIFSQGFVAASSNVDGNELISPLAKNSLTDAKKVDNHLIKMGFTADELKRMPETMKADIASSGGKKIAASKIDTTAVYVDEHGNRSPVITLANDDDGLQLWGWVVKIGSTSTENKYAAYVEYEWPTGPFWHYTDTVAMAWQSRATPYGDPLSQHNWRPSGSHHVYNNAIDKQQVEGNAWKVDIIGGGSPQDGWGRQELRVGKSYEGQTGAIEIGYVHRLAPGTATVTISYGALSFSGTLQTEYNGRFNFTY